LKSDGAAEGDFSGELKEPGVQKRFLDFFWRLPTDALAKI
jgi:hypothetical protein